MNALTYSLRNLRNHALRFMLTAAGISAALVSLLAFAVGALGSLYPAWRATRMRPMELLRGE
jgi:ABC-type antimicrobial peptide transport system permease subunit